jgi:hypothetical protein
VVYPLQAARAMHVRPTSLALVLGGLFFSSVAIAQSPPPGAPPPGAPPAPPPPFPAAPAAPPVAPAAPPPMLPAAPPPMMPGAPPPMMPGAPPMTPGAPPMMPPGGWQPPPPAPPSAAEVPPADAAPAAPGSDGVTAKGLPFSQRGGLVLDVAAMRFAGANAPAAAIDVIAHIPIAEHTFFDAVLPIGFGAVGNPMVGAHHVFRPADRIWLTLGGAFGVPLVNTNGFENFQYARALWDMEEFARYTVPFILRFGLEAHAGLAEFRVQLEPAWGISVNGDNPLFGTSGVNHLVTIQHAFEAQLGHAIGGGIRYQGVAVPTDSVQASGSSAQFDHYQGSMELFFRLYHDPIFARAGLVLPLDNPLGESNNARTWGVRVSTGWNLD